MKLLLQRYSFEKKQTIGKLFLLNKNEGIIKEWDSLELPWLNNKRKVSSIPEGEYTAIKHRSPKFGQSLWLQNVPNRSEILIHKGNFYRDTLGCILIGTDLSDIDKDGNIDVINSVKAINELLNNIKTNSIKITINNKNYE